MLKTYVFGAGEYGRRLLAYKMINNERIDGVIVSSRCDNPSAIMGYRVEELSSIKDEIEYVEIELGVDENKARGVAEYLDSKGFKKIKRVCINPVEKKYYPDVSNKDFLAVWYLYITDKTLDWNCLRSFNEKLQWLKLYDQSPLKKRLADKYLVRDYVEKKIGKEYLVPILGCWGRFDDIRIDQLPNQFVLKCNHGSGWNVIVENKYNENWDDVKRRFNNWMQEDYSDCFGLELQYSGIERQIIAEKLLRNNEDKDIPDYKFFVFGGTVKYIQVDIDRRNNHRRNIYSPSWEYLPVSIHYPTDPSYIVKRPARLDDMISISEELGKGFAHVRVDLYYLDNRVYFGEMTFTHGSGIERFEPEEFGNQLGDCICLPEENHIE